MAAAKAGANLGGHPRPFAQCLAVWHALDVGVRLAVFAAAKGLVSKVKQRGLWVDGECPCWSLHRRNSKLESTAPCLSCMNF